eukprot:44489_1
MPLHLLTAIFLLIHFYTQQANGQQHTVLYVSSNGTDLNNTNCSQQSSCGTLYWALELIQNDPITSPLTDFEILITGFNTADMMYNHSITITMSVNLTFDMIHHIQLSEWQAIVGPIHIHPRWDGLYHFVINNLYINGHGNHVIPVMILHPGRSTETTLILNNCTFKDVVCDIDYSIDSWTSGISWACFINTYGLDKSRLNIAIYDSVFSNISSNAPLIQAYYTNVALIRSTFHDLYWINSPIIFTKHYDDIRMQHNTFNNIKFLYNQNATTFDDCSVATLLCIECPYDALNVVYINDSSFHNINGPIITSRRYGYTGYRLQCRYNLNVFMSDITISTSRVIVDYIMKETDRFFDYYGKEYNYDKALIIASFGTELVMNNITLTYKVIDNLNDNCVIGVYWPSVSNQTLLARCVAPYRFLYNEGSGYIDMNNVYITNDVTQEGLQQFKSDWIVSNSMQSDVVYSFVFVYIDANDPYSYLSEPDTEIIFNNGSQLFIHNMSLYGVALHERVLRNIGTAFIDNFYLLRPDYWHDNLIHVKPLMRQVFKHEGYPNDLDINNYDSEFVNEHQCFFSASDFENGFLFITDSIIFGGTVAVHVTGGMVEIHNTSISNVVSAVYAEDATSVKIISSHLQNIGRYHVAAWISWRIFDTSWFEEVVWLSSIEHIIIRKNVFDFFPVYWYLFIANSYDAQTNVYAEVSDNEFKNPITRNTFNVDQFGTVWREYMQHRDDWNDTFDAVQLTYAIFGSPNHYRRDLVNFIGFVNASFIGNIFHHDELMTALESSCLSVNSYSSTVADEHSVCILGNMFYGRAITLRYGANVTSCIYPELSVHNNTECWHNYGPFNGETVDKYTDTNGDRFTATNVDVPLFTIMGESTIIIYNAIISTQFEDANGSIYNPFNLDPEWWFQSEMNGIISFLDVIINESSNAIEIQFYEECINKCTEIHQESLNDIHQLHLNCINVPTESSSISLSESLSLISLNNTLPYRVFLNSSGVFYPGGTLDLNYVILDSYDNIISDYNQSISIALLSTDFSFETTLYLQRLSTCDICETGLYVPNAKMNESANNSYIIVANVTDNSLHINDLNVTMTQCPTGYGFNSRLSICYECHIGECSIKPSLGPCISCVGANTLKGVSCIGGDKVMISHNYWVAFNYFGDGQIVSQYCPNSYCNQIHSGLYLELLAFEQLCSLNRDPEVALCGSCKRGYSELYGSANCGKCDRHRYELWILLVIIPILFTLFIIFIDGNAPFIPSDSPEQKSKKCICCRKTCHLNDEAKQYIKISLAKPISYYYQCVTFILVNGGIFVYLSGFAEIFNFQFDFGQQNKSNSSGYCVFKGFNAKFEIISRLLIPSCCILTLIIMMIVRKVRGQYRFCGRRVFLVKSAVSILLLTISSFCGVCFKLLSCRNIGNDYLVHFYFGSDECFDTIWFVSLFVLVLFVLIFCSLFMKLYDDHKKQDSEYLKQNTYVLSSLVKSYKINQYWYWELIIFSKRLLVAMLTVVYMDNVTVKNILFVSLALYLCAQIYCNPFKTERINSLETICTLCLLLILYILDNATDEEESTFSLILLNMVLLLPLILWIIQLMQILQLCSGTCTCNEWEANTPTRIEKEQQAIEMVYAFE